VRRTFCLATLFFGIHAVAQECTVSVPLSVVNEQAADPIPSLSAEQFRAVSGGSALHISAVEQIHTRRLLILVDESGSVSGPGDSFLSHKKRAVDTVLKAVDQLLDALPQGLSLQYGVFADTALFGKGFFTDPKELRVSISDVNARFHNIKRHDYTALYDALLEAGLRFQDSRLGDSILLITDGDDNASKRSLKAAQEALSESHINLSLILVNADFPSPTGNSQQVVDGGVWPAGDSEQDELISAAQHTGGTVQIIDATKREWGFKEPVRAAGVEIARFLRERLLNSYVVSVQVPVTWSKEMKWKLWLAVSDPKLKRAVLNYPHRLPVCASALAVSR
jgi:hypothetical protein